MRALSRKKANRKSTLRNLATSLVLYEKIKTTTAKAKELKPVVEHLISIAKANDLNSRRRLLSYLFDENAVKKMIEVLVPRYIDTKSGFVTSVKLGNRIGDGAEVTLLELKQIKISKVEDKEDKNGKSKQTIETAKAKPRKTQ